MLKQLIMEANMDYTENGAVTNSTSGSDCLDFFATVGALRHVSDEEIVNRFTRAYAEDPDIATKILFYSRDIRGGLGERRTFKVILRYLANCEQETVRKNIENIAEYGRFDDLLVLMGTTCEDILAAYYKDQLHKDIKAFEKGEEVSLLAKWLPSINTSNKEAVMKGKKLAKMMGYSPAEYRKILSTLRAHIKIIENNLRKNDYTFDYEKQTSKALFKYRKAFFRNDEERYRNFLNKAAEDPSVMHTGTLAPYEIISPMIGWPYKEKSVTKDIRKAMDVTWNALPNYVGSENALVVVDGSGSMYWGANPLPAAVAESLGIYFAEHNTGAFKNHFITFSSNPKIVKIKGKDIFEKVKYCMGYNECSNTNIAATFDLILKTAVKNEMKQSDMPSRLYIISDMEFDSCADNASLTNFERAKREYEKRGYKLPELVFWNVNSRNRQQPVTMNEKGVVLVSGCTPQIFSMVQNDGLDPYKYMMTVVNSDRYEKIVA